MKRKKVKSTIIAIIFIIIAATTYSFADVGSFESYDSGSSWSSSDYESSWSSSDYGSSWSSSDYGDESDLTIEFWAVIIFVLISLRIKKCLRTNKFSKINYILRLIRIRY